MCVVNSTLWSFPTAKYENVVQQIEVCEISLNTIQQQVRNKALLYSCHSTYYYFKISCVDLF